MIQPSNPAPKSRAISNTSSSVQTPQDIDWEVLFSALPHPIILVGANNRIHYANAAAETFYDISLTVLSRQTLDDVVAFGCPLLTLVDQVREFGSTVNEYAVEMASPRYNGVKLVDVYAGPVPVAAGTIMIMLQQRSMAQMIERQLTHRAAARSVSGMAAILAHEIKNPLSGIRGAAQLLETNASDDDRELTQLICNETERIRQLVDRMEVFGDERPLSTEPVNIHGVLDHVCKLAESGFGADVTIVKDFDPSLPPVRGNRDKLIQVFLNLLKNACEALTHQTDQGQVTLTTGFRPGVRLSIPGSVTRISLPLMVEVTDDGAGVPEAIRSHLFDPFVTTKTSGTGLGLALVAKIIGDHGGVIECESEPGRTTFRVLLALDDTAPVNFAASHQEDTTDKSRKRKPSAKKKSNEELH
jgi:two-component system, NtrC family, nitrogen regulation sensor histidine kinase GlnL